MRRSHFGRDRGLQARMVLTMLMLAAFYAAIVTVVIIGGVGIIIGVAIAAVVALVPLLSTDKIALAAIGAREVSPAERPTLHALVERLCVQADIPKPRVAVAFTHMPNACALGRSRKRATICVTTGLLTLLSEAELEAVLAHEVTHVINCDVMVMTLASFLAVVAAAIARFSLWVGAKGNVYGVIAMVFLLVCSAIAYVVTFVLVRTLSRYREFAADRGAAIITGRPSALSSALLKLTGLISQIPKRDLRTAAQINAFFIVPAGRGGFDEGLFADHPPIEKRIAALNRLEAQLQQTA